MSIVAERLAILAEMPFGKAAAGDRQAQTDLAGSFYIAGRDGMMDGAQALAVAMAFGRLAAWHGDPYDARALAVYLIAHAGSLHVAEARQAALAEAVAWLHRAAEGGDEEADNILENLPDSEDGPAILAMAAEIEKSL